MSQIVKKKQCRLCESKDLTRVFKLCISPLANNLVTKKTDSLKVKKYPLNLMFCNECKHVQLEHVVNSKALYVNYLYMTGISQQFKRHFKNYVDKVLKLFNKVHKLQVLEIGSNDCTLLDYFKEKKCVTVGVEPAQNLWDVTKNNHDIFNSFYNSKTNSILFKKYKSFDIITANNVFAHIDDIQKVFLLLKDLMHNKSLIIFEVSYLSDVINKNLFDTIYHEHLDYHSVTPLISFFNKIDLKIIDIEKVSSHGGSIRVFVAKDTSARLIKRKKIEKLIQQEKRIVKKSAFIKFYNKLEKEKIKLKEFFQKIQNETVYGYGASAKVVTLMNYFNLDHNNIKLIVDDSEIKQNKYIPGTQIRITSSRILNAKPPKYIIIFAWNIYKDILFKLKNYKNINYIIIPLPKFKIIKI